MGLCKSKLTQSVYPTKDPRNKDSNMTSIEREGSNRTTRIPISTFYKNTNDITEQYNIFPITLGKGSFAEVKKAYHKPTGTYRAVKIINKVAMSKSEQIDVRNEIQVLKRLNHPNIVKVFEFFENDLYLYIIMELLTGGELFDKINKAKRFSEKKAAGYFYQILAGVQYLHKHHIVHRDLKPENILFDDKTLKIIDFGTSKIYDGDKAMKKFKGTPFYMAPEVLRGKYTAKCDAWSCGVILYILLTGKAPFNGSSDQEIFENVMDGHYSLSIPEFKNVSQEAKSLVRKLLIYDDEERITIEQALNDIWFRKIMESKEKTFDKSVLYNIKKFNAKNKIQKAIYYFLVSHISNKDDERKLINAFKNLDANNDGVLTRQELQEGFKKSSTRLNESSLSVIMERVTFDNKDGIEYNEFMAAAMDRNKLINDENIKICFNMFDQDGNGKISFSEFQHMFHQTDLSESGILKEFLYGADLNKDGEIDFEEFKNILINLM